MIDLHVMIEINGKNRHVGNISGSNYADACFKYADSYLQNSENRPISISLPFSEDAFTPVQTRNFFEGLLPEGFTRKCVAEWLRADETDYIAILSGLGKECLGAIKVVDDLDKPSESGYRKLSTVMVKKLAQEGAERSADIVTKSHLSLTGASGKVGLYYDDENKKWYQPIGDSPSTHIVKQSHVRLKKIITNEQLCLLTAGNLGIQIPESFIIHASDKKDTNGEELLLATKRYDRKSEGSLNVKDGLKVPFRLHQEDFAQALGIASADKYEKNNEGYLKKAFELLREYSADPIEDQLKLWDIFVFDYLVGNTDNHIKNISLLYSEDMKSVRLAPAYDIVSTEVYESSTENMAVSIGGIYDISKIKRKSFEKEADNIGLGKKIAMNHFDDLVERFEKAMMRAMEQLDEQLLKDAEELSKKILNNSLTRIQAAKRP